jgi:hypothetical protein
LALFGTHWLLQAMRAPNAAVIARHERP